MPKTRLLLCIMLFSWLRVSAQKESNVKLTIETGLLTATGDERLALLNKENFGFYLTIEPTLKTSNNTRIGLRIGAAGNTQKIGNQDALRFNFKRNISEGIIQFIDIDNSVISFVPTFNYYFIEKKLQPHVGLGVGYHFLKNYTDISKKGVTNPSENLLKLNVKNQVGVLLRGGLNVGKFLFSLEYNYIPKTDIKVLNGQLVGTVDNSYIGLSIGYVLAPKLQK